MENETPPQNIEPRDTQNSDPDSSLEQLRQILLRSHSTKMEELEAELGDLEHQINDEGKLIKLIAPVLGDAIRFKIHEARDEMIEALHPIIGQVVQRAVMEGISDLARSIDAQAKRTFNFRLIWWRIRASISGDSEAKVRLREFLPFAVTDILLIHRETGLLLFHLPSEISVASDTDLVSGMLTAIRDFSRETLGGTDQTELGGITYGGQHILIEAAQKSYLGMIVNGTPPLGLRAEMRDRLIEIEHSHATDLRNYQGDSQSMASVEDSLSSLMTSSRPQGMRPTQKRLLVGAIGALSLILISCCFFINWIWQQARVTTMPPVVAVQATATFTNTPSASPTTISFTPTLTITPVPSTTQTTIPTLIGVILSNVWVSTEPSLESDHIGAILFQGQNVEILSIYGDWVRVCREYPGESEVIGWVPARWVMIPSSIQSEIITPTSNP